MTSGLRVGVGVAAALLASIRPAAADLETDTDRLAAAWRPYGNVSISSPRIIERGQLVPLLIPPSVLDPVDPDCATIAVLGATTTSFAIDVYPRGGTIAPGLQLPISSLAGAAEVTRCGAQKVSFARLGVEMRSPRAVIRVLTLRSARRAVSLVRALPHRDPGPFAPLTRSGPRPPLAPLAARIAAFEQTARLAGAAEVGRAELVAESDGAGSTTIRLDEGCHQLTVMSDGSGRNTPDVDALATDMASETILAEDHSDASDASMSLCVGERTVTRVQFVGATPRAKLGLLHARFRLPVGIPERWGATTRGRMAETLWAHGLTNLGSGPVYQSIGVQGTTLLPVPAEPGACYTLGLALVQGQVGTLGMTAQSGNRSDETVAAPEESATSIALCAAEPRLAISVEVRSAAGAVWMFAIWRTGRLRLGEEDH